RAMVVLPAPEPPVMAMIFMEIANSEWRVGMPAVGPGLFATRYSLGDSAVLLQQEVARRGGLFHQALFDRARRAEEVALAIRHVEVKHFEDGVLILDPLGDNIDAVALEHRRDVHRRDLAGDG